MFAGCACAAMNGSEFASVWLPIVILVLLSGLFSGLTLGLLSLDIKQLENVIRGGNEQEQKWANRILPTRKHGNWLLCTLLLGNVAVNAMLSILLADMTSGLMGFLTSTALIVIFGEITPQAFCSRYGLAIGFYTVPIVWVFMAVLAPIAWPISFILDKALGAEMGQIYTRSMFKHLILQHAEETQADFDADESNIMFQVIELKEKKVTDIMTPLEQVFAIEYSAKLDFEQLARIMECGHSRIPVYNKNLQREIVGLLFVKDLVLLNPDDEFLVKDILHYYNHIPLYVDIEGMNLSELLHRILEGSCHLVVCRSILEDPAGGDNVYQNVGIITLEDVIAQLLGKHEPEEAVEALTTTPVSATSGQPKAGSGQFEQRHFIDMFRRKKAHNSLSPNEITMIYQILIAKVPAFTAYNIPKSKAIQLLKAATILELGGGSILYESGTPTESFTLLLEGHVEIVCGAEGFLVEVGPWTPIGTKALSTPDYCPDFTARAREGGSSIKFLQITRSTFDEFVQMAAEPEAAPSEGYNTVQPPDTTSSLMEPNTVRSRSSSRSMSGASLTGAAALQVETSNPIQH